MQDARRGDDPRRVQGGRRRRSRRSVSAHDLRRSDAPLRLGQARSAHRARARRRRRAREDTPSSRCFPARPTIRAGASPRCACRTARATAQVSRRSRSRTSRVTAPRASPGSASTTWPRAARHDLADHQVPRRRALRRFSTRSARPSGDVIFFGAGPYKTVSDFMGALRLKVARDCGLVANTWAPLWVTDFPMFEYDHEAKRYVALHHPFTAPKVDDIADLKAERRSTRSRAATTWCSTATRSAAARSASIVRTCRARCSSCSASAPTKRRRNSASCSKRSSYGAPPHGGIAFGIDRIAALMAGTESIRDVIAFPKTATAQDLMTDAPSTVADAQLPSCTCAVRREELMRCRRSGEAGIRTA